MPKITEIMSEFDKSFSIANFTWTNESDAKKSRLRMKKLFKSSLSSLLDEVEKLTPKEKPMGVFSFVLKGEELERYMRYRGFNECRGEFLDHLSDLKKELN